MHNSEIKRIFQDSIDLKQRTLSDEHIINQISDIAEDIITSLRQGGKLLLAGNGGSYADTIHIAGEFVSRLMFDRGPLPAIALGSNNTILTAIGNDYGFEDIFTREFEALARPKDVLLCISTSGNSPNILNLIKLAKEKQIETYLLTGSTDGRASSILENENMLKIPSEITARIQEVHITIGHIICEIVEKEMFAQSTAREIQSAAIPVIHPIVPNKDQISYNSIQKLAPKGIELIVYDFDGVMTDNKVIVDENATESVAVNRGDGYAIRKIKELGINQIILSTEKNKVVAARAEKLKLPVIHGVDDKYSVLSKYCDDNKVNLNKVLYIGNDTNDLEAMLKCGKKVCPSDAEYDIIKIADIVLSKKGGQGVIRELLEYLL